MQLSISERENVGILKARKYVGRQCQQMSVSSQLARAETDGVSEAETKQRLSSLPSISDRKSTRLNSSHSGQSRMPSSA